MRNLLAITALLGLFLPAAALAQKKTPYWASIAAGKARMRTGPGRNFPAVWLYQRAGLPVKVVETYPNWRRIEDPEGVKGWLQANLLSEDRTALVKGNIQPLHASPDREAPVIFRVEPGVVGKISQCARGWCRLDTSGRSGWVQTASVWGTSPDEN